MADAEPRSVDELLRENRTLERRLRRLQDDIRQLEEFQDSNATLRSRLLEELEQERAKSQRLLLNVLPQRIIDRLAAGEQRIADRHEDVAVLFSDFVGFTGIAGALDAAELVQDLNSLFRRFDAICEETGVEKIKTIGDAYLAVAGLGDASGPGSAGNAAAIAETSLRMCAATAERSDGHARWEIRIGIHVGPVVAGVVGVSKFAYDVWGDTVNTASRLETTSEGGRIHVSAELARRLETAFVVEPRGLVDLKGKGATETYWLVGRRAPNS